MIRSKLCLPVIWALQALLQHWWAGELHKLVGLRQSSQKGWNLSKPGRMGGIYAAETEEDKRKLVWQFKKQGDHSRYIFSCVFYRRWSHHLDKNSCYISRLQAKCWPMTQGCITPVGAHAVPPLLWFLLRIWVQGCSLISLSYSGTKELKPMNLQPIISKSFSGD